jgi:Flp pilus assembly pilin Flp
VLPGIFAVECYQMMNLAEELWADESGAETAEWVVIVAFLVIVATAIFQGTVRGTLTNVAGSIGDQVIAETESWRNHGEAVSSTATGSSTGGVSTTAKSNRGG